MKLTFVLISLALVCCMTAAAQTTSGTIGGTVVDASHGALNNATVTATERGKAFTLNATSDAAGRFSFGNVPPGTYKITVTVAGFKEFVQDNVELNANDRLSLGEISMSVGAVSEHVEVSAAVQQLQTESAERSEALVSKQILNIAVNSRSPLDLVKLVPGVVSTVNLQTAGPGGLASISANGVRQNSNQATINGIGNVDTGSNGSLNATVSLDSIQEFKILTGVYQAEYGRAMGAQINMVTKSGSSDLHGSGYFQHRNDSLNANNWLNNRNGLPRNLYRFNDVGFTVGGPVYIPKIFTERKKLFFFVSEEFQRQLRPEATRNVTVPTAAERTGDFSNSVDSNGNKLYIKDPLLTGTCSAASQAACFPNNIIPANRQYAPGIALLKIFPSPTVMNSCALTPGAAGCIKGYNYQSQISDQYPRREDLIKIDYNMTNNMRLFGHWINNSNTYVGPTNGAFVLGTNTPLSPIAYANPGHSWALGHSWILSPTMTNELNIGTSKNSINIDATTPGLTRTATGVNLPLLYPSAVQEDFLPALNFGGKIANTPAFGNADAPFINYNTTLSITDGLSKVHGSHAFKFGFFAERSWKDQTSFGDFNGSYNFGDNTANPLDTGFGYSNAALGVYNSFDQAANHINGQYRYWNFEFYAQDTWKVTKNLTVDYGIRAAYYQPQYDQSLQAATFLLSGFDPTKASRLYQPVASAANCPALSPSNRCGFDAITNTYVANPFIGALVPGTGSITNGIFQGGQGPVNKYFQNTPPPQWGPRLGIAWDPFGSGKVVIRTGFGIYYDRYQGNRVFDFVRNPPLGTQPVLNYGYASQINPATAILAPPTVYASDPVGKIPNSMSYQFSIQSKLPWGMILDSAFVGNQGRHLEDNRNLNPSPYGVTFLAANQDATLSVVSPNALLGTNAKKDVLIRPLQGLSTATIYEAAATSNYNAAQFTLDKRAGRFFFGISYTWSKYLTTTPASAGDTANFSVDSLNRYRNYGPSANDRRQSFAMNYVYNVPDKGRNQFMKMLINGWQVSGVTRFQTGTPLNPGISITGAGNAQITGSNTEGTRIAVVPGANPNTGTDNPYMRINAAAFAAPLQGSIGTESGINFLTGPGINNFDLSLSKSFKMTERAGLELRIDAFNVFNHTQFSGLNTTLTFANAGGNVNAVQNGVFGGSTVIGPNGTVGAGGVFTAATPSNLYLKSDGTVNNINGFGTVNGARDPRILQLFARIRF